MTKDEMSGLNPGDLVRHKLHGSAMIVHQNHGDAGLIAVRVQHISNPDEWHRVRPDGSIKEEDEA